MIFIILILIVVLLLISSFIVDFVIDKKVKVSEWSTEKLERKRKKYNPLWKIYYAIAFGLPFILSWPVVQLEQKYQTKVFVIILMSLVFIFIEIASVYHKISKKIKAETEYRNSKLYAKE